MNELFGSEVQVKSPRLRWIEKHKLCIQDNGEPGEDEGGEWKRFSAYRERGENTVGYIGQGDTADDAVADWAKHYGVRLWNEE